ncbi:MAG: hypothetical protein HJJLKODD_00780 [Phycisphaerae bacterium]|nr:hypothetical protein [Phycisphaerae bacterium]
MLLDEAELSKKCGAEYSKQLATNRALLKAGIVAEFVGELRSYEFPAASKQDR